MPLPRHRARHRSLTRTAVATLVAVLAAVWHLTAGTVTAQAAEIDPGAYYQLISRHSGKALDVAGSSTAEGAGIVQNAPSGSASQQFRFLDSGDGYYRLQARHSGMVLDVFEHSTEDGAEIVQWSDLGNPNQQFAVTDTGSGYVKLVNRLSGKALDVWEWSTADGARISQYTDTGGTNQQWQLVEADGGDPGATFTNPIVTQNAADPWIVRHEGRYYHLGTTWASHWEMRSAETLAGLRDAQPVTVYQENDPSRCCNFWAPELHRLDGPNGTRWYLTYSAGVSGNIDHQHVHVLESAGDDPMGPYHYQGQIDPYGDNRWMIDSSYLTAPDGNLYLLYSFWEGGTQNLYVAPMNNPWTPAGAGVRIADPQYGWEQQGSPVNEAPEVLQHNGRTFLTFSASSCNTPDYKLGLMELTGSNPMNPGAWYKFPDPVFERNDAAGVYGPGHNGFFTSPDGSESWIVYHANDSASDGCSGTRTSRAQKIEWNADGTPDFGTPVGPGIPLQAPSGE